MCLHERFVDHLLAVNLTADEARHELTMRSHTQPMLSDRATSSDLDIRWRQLTDAAVTISKMKGQKEFIYWALSGCFVNNGVTS